MRAASVCLPLILVCTNELAAQDRRHRLAPVDALLSLGAVGVYAVPHVFSINQHPSSCGPCDRQAVPWLDRWAIAEPRDAMDAASTALVLLLAAAETIDLAPSGPAHYGEIGYLAESAAWALGATELIKAAVARKRPVLYTADASVARNDLDAQRSWPSGHAAVAAALAAGYWLVPRERPTPAWRRWAVLGAATAVSALRVAAGRHFPSDVAGGAALGVVSGVTVRAIRF
ncbi:MAG: phosphatase PAP2 family protein [Gemmatimonadetes bacterium]|nr:phosphatase PAP2 family protein [Gemmatimonadota bacterium]